MKKVRVFSTSGTPNKEVKKKKKHHNVYRKVHEGVRELFNEIDGEPQRILEQRHCGRSNPLHTTASDDFLAVPGKASKYIRNVVGDKRGLVRIDTAPKRNYD